MRITVKRVTTVGEILESLKREYGSMTKLREHVREHPNDLMARLALHDYREYGDDPPSKVVRETREIVLPDKSLDQLTAQRLHLLIALGALHDRSTSVRGLARRLNRDVKNVSQDVNALSQIGLVQLRRHGRGKPAEVALAGEKIDLHLVEA